MTGSCSCQQKTSCTCQTATAKNACGCTTTSICSCGNNDTVINPKTIIPVTSTEDASNKFSIEHEIKPRNGSGTFNSTRAGTATGDDTDAIVADMHEELRQVTIEIIKAIIGDSYTSTAITAEDPITSVELADIATFQAYFTTGAEVGGNPITGGLSLAQINYITQVMKPAFDSIEKHIRGADDTIVICPAGGRVFRLQISNCLFCLNLIYN